MKTIQWKDLAITALAIGTLVIPTQSARADESDKETRQQDHVTIIVQETDKAEESAPKTFRLGLIASDHKPGEYFIGVVCSPLDNELVQSQLGLKHGIVITQVVPDSPAAKAGLKTLDILTVAGDQELSDLKVLVECTEKAKEGKLLLTFYRQGKKQTVELTPAKRPATLQLRKLTKDKEAMAEWKMLQETFRKHGAITKDAAKEVTKMLRVMPGFVIPDGAQNFPNNLEVTITKKGEAPAKITVRRGDDAWEVDEESLDKLPEDVRPHVKRMVSGGLSIKFGAKSLDWSGKFSKPPVIPHLNVETLKKSFKVGPGQHFEFHEFSHDLPAELKKKIDAQLEQARKNLKAAQSQVPTEVLDKIQDELKELREQLERLREQKSKKRDEDGASGS